MDPNSCCYFIPSGLWLCPSRWQETEVPLYPVSPAGPVIGADVTSLVGFVPSVDGQESLKKKKFLIEIIIIIKRRRSDVMDLSSFDSTCRPFFDWEWVPVSWLGTLVTDIYGWAFLSLSARPFSLFIESIHLISSRRRSSLVWLSRLRGFFWPNQSNQFIFSVKIPTDKKE